ncbi:MAG TPA: DNA-binding protein [Rhodanobacteraceae bacterium]
MPHGITQEQVDQAADALLQAGERPTVEKVRAKLGTGSPNTITRMLDAWRQGLADRLRKANELPGLPEEVRQTMTALWGQAVQHARERTQREIEAERDALQQSRTALDAREAEQAALLASAQGAAGRAEEDARRAAVETTALRRLVDRLETEAKEHAAERARLLALNETLEAACTKLRDDLRTAEAKAATERTTRDEYTRVVEDRAHVEVDRVRTELKAAHAELVGTRKRHQAEIQALQRTVTELTRALRAAEREAAHQRGVAEALKLKRSRNVTVNAAKRPSGAQRGRRSRKVTTRP